MYPAILLNEGNATAEYLTEVIRYNRFSGYNGEIFFSYEGLRRDHDKLAAVLKETFYAHPALLPFAPVQPNDKP